MRVRSGGAVSGVLDWVVVGGGIHGTHLAIVLLARGGVPAQRIRLLDPHDEPLARWHARAAAVGMRFLRSGSAHHTDLDPLSLSRFARRLEGGAREHLALPWGCPSVRLFAAHGEHTEDKWDLGAIRERGTVRELRDGGDRVVVETDRGELVARNVLLAIGRDGCRRPEWSAPLADGSSTVRLEHVFDPGFRLEGSGAPGSTVVVGDGMSAVQAACRLARRARETGGANVTLLAGREPIVQPFDTDPGWFGPRRLAGFRRERCVARRRRAIDSARHVGSVTPRVRDELRALSAAGALRVVVSRDVTVAPGSGSGVVLRTPRGDLPADRVICATGFGRERPGGAWVDRAIETFGLPTAPCGYPVPDDQLRWHPRIRVAGPLAELALGPAAGNIVGARRAGERLVDGGRH